MYKKLWFNLEIKCTYSILILKTDVIWSAIVKALIEAIKDYRPI